MSEHDPPPGPETTSGLTMPDHRRAAGRAPPAIAAGLRLTVIEGPDTGATFDVEPGAPQRTLVGTSSACAIRLTDPTVSRRHLAIEPPARGDLPAGGASALVPIHHRVTDLGSLNGTFIDGVRVIDALLRGDEVLRCGRTAFAVGLKRYDAPSADERSSFGRLLGESEVMRRLYPLLDRLAASRVPVLIEGEPGTGKELLAEALHEASSAAGPFVVFDPAAGPASFAEADLCGSEGGPRGDTRGALELADGGTLFVDDVAELSAALQARLLHAIERGDVLRAGGRENVRVSFRLLAATRRDLDREVAAGRFREDLYQHLGAGRVELPPLRRRAGDVSLLARAFAARLGARSPLSADLLARFEEHAWPGNVRELHRAVAQAVALGDAAFQPAPPDEDEAAARAIDALIDERVPLALLRKRVIELFEQRYVERILDRHGGHVGKAAAASGLAHRYFQILKARRRAR